MSPKYLHYLYTHGPTFMYWNAFCRLPLQSKQCRLQINITTNGLDFLSSWDPSAGMVFQDQQPSLQSSVTQDIKTILVIIPPFHMASFPCKAILPSIGTCRAVWVPRQALAMPHLIRNFEKHYFVTIHCTLYVCLCTHMLYICW